MLTITEPTKCRLSGYDASVAKHLEYQDKAIDFEIKLHKKNRWFVAKYGQEAFDERLAELKTKRINSLLFTDEQGYWTYSGLSTYLQDKFQDQLSINIEYPEPKTIPWSHVPVDKLRPYQVEAIEKLLAIRHGAVELATGLGKTYIIMMLLKELGLQAVIMPPSVPIAEQIHDQLVYHFGSKYVGAYFDGKKQYNRLFTIGIPQSLSKLSPQDPAWQQLSKAQVFITDESHLVAANTLAKVSLELMKSVPYRFFFSGTQMRNDGKDLLLSAITGPIVQRMTVQEGVEAGYLARPVFRMIKCRTPDTRESQDANLNTRRHLYYNPMVNQIAGDLANKCVDLMKRKVLILVEEMEQLTHLLPHLHYKTYFAHGGVTKANRDKVPAAYHESDPMDLVKRFDAGEFPILVGTSCISIGTDIKSVGAIIYLQGGTSEIQIRQAIGRGTRLQGDKRDCFFFDVDVENSYTAHRHAAIRKEIYQDVYPDFKENSL